jgi:hypothetical protein
MFLQRSVIAAARRVAVTPAVRRSFATSMVRRTCPLPQAQIDLESGGVIRNLGIIERAREAAYELQANVYRAQEMQDYREEM